MADNFYKKRGIFDEDRSGFAFREVFTPTREGPLPPRRPGEPRPPGKGGPSINQGAAPAHSAEAIAYLARTVGGNEGGNAANITALIDGLVADGVWAKLDALYVLAQQNQTDALLNLVGTSYGLNQVGLLRSVAFTQYVGFGNFASGVYLDTNFNSTTATSPKYTQNSASFGAWIYNATHSGPSGAIVGSGSASHLYPNFNDTSNFYARLNNSSVGPVTTTITKGLFVGDRPDASNVYPYQNGVSGGPLAFASAPNDNADFLVGGAVGQSFSTYTLSAAFIGASLGASGQLALYNRLNTYMTAVTPTSVWSAADAAANAMTLSNGGLTVVATTSTWQSVRGSISHTSGKYYMEFLISNSPSANTSGFGLADASFGPASYLGSNNYSSSNSNSGGVTLVSPAGFSAYGNSGVTAVPSINDVFQIAVDLTSGYIWYGKNNTWFNTGNPAAGTLYMASIVAPALGLALYPAISLNGSAAGLWTLQATAASQKYAPPAGFSAWG